jgi:hypothetical protein
MSEQSLEKWLQTKVKIGNVDTRKEHDGDIRGLIYVLRGHRHYICNFIKERETNETPFSAEQLLIAQSLPNDLYNNDTVRTKNFTTLCSAINVLNKNVLEKLKSEYCETGFDSMKWRGRVLSENDMSKWYSGGGRLKLTRRRKSNIKSKSKSKSKSKHKHKRRSYKKSSYRIQRR